MTRLLGSLRSSLSKFFLRGYKSNISSPTHSPGFILFDRVEELTFKSPINDDNLPKSISSLLNPLKATMPSLKGRIRESEIGSLVRAHPNQEPIALHQLVKLRPIEQLNLSEAFALDLEEALLGASEGTIETGDDAMECANVLKKRRRRMRGHKHKKRLKERRHKADK